jgi:hypothetical protein
MLSKREDVLKRLERFNHTISTSAKFTIFSKPEHPDPALEIKLSRITALSDISHLEELVQEFNTNFTPCRIEYSLENTTTAPGESNITGHSQAEAMGKLADEFDMSEEFDAVCIAVDETNTQEPFYVFQEKLMKAFSERWAMDNKEAHVAKIHELGFSDALESQDLERLVAIMSDAQKPMWLAFWNRINELTGNEMNHAAIKSLVEQATEAGKNSVKEALENFWATNVIAVRV